MSRLRISFLGTFRATLDGEEIYFKTDKGRALLAYLAIENQRPHRREVLAGLLWSDQPEDRALHSLRQTISSLRKRLNDKDAERPYLYVDRSTIQFDPDGDTWLDIDAFKTAAREGLPQNQGSKILQRVNIRRLNDALELYQGHFLDQLYLRGSPLFDEWAILQRESLARQALEVMGVLVDYHEIRLETALTCRIAEQIVSLVPWEETARRTVMRMLAQEGRYGAVEMSYQACERYLESELSVKPAAETRTLMDEIRQYAQENLRYPARYPAPRSNLPAMPTAFVGRDEELASLANLFSDPKNHLITLLGPGGIGKSRLAVHAAREQVGIFQDGVFFVPLAPLNEPDLFVSALAETIGFSFYSSKDPASQLVDHLRDKEMLLVLDNIEHLLNGSSTVYEAIGTILDDAPGVVLLVTSRQPLQLWIERVLELDGLAFPQPQEKNSEMTGELEAYSALRLFDQIGTRVNPRFSIGADLAGVVDICQVLHGVPLAIELSASWVREYSVDEIARQIHRDLNFVETTMRGMPDRHRSLRAVFEHSWLLLTKPEQVTFSKLSLFQGGFSADAALEVAGASETVLSSLVNKSLLQGTASERYDMHDLVKQFAREKLEHTPDEYLLVGNQHCDYFLSYLQAREFALHGPDPLIPQGEISREIKNIRLAWKWAGKEHRIEQLRQSANSLARFFDMRSWFLEGKETFQDGKVSLERKQDYDESGLQALAKVSAHHGWFLIQLGEYQSAVDSMRKMLALVSKFDAPEETSQVLNILGSAVYELGDFTAAKEAFERSVRLCEQIDQASLSAFAHNYLGSIARNEGAFPEAEKHFRRSHDAYQALDDQWGLARVLNNMGSMAGMSGDYAGAAVFFQQSLDIRRRLQDQAGIAGCLHNLSNIAYIDQDYQKTRALREECLAICREIGFTWGVASTLKHLGDVDKALGDLQLAGNRYMESLEISRKSGDRRSEAFTLSSMGSLFLLQRNYHQARTALAAALKMALEIKVIPLVLDILVGIAELTAQEGDFRLAFDLASYVLEHEGGEKQTQDKALELKIQFEAAVPPEERQNWILEFENLTLDRVVDHLFFET